MRAYGQVQALISSGCEVKVITSEEQGFEVNMNFQPSQQHQIFYKSNKKSFASIQTKKLVLQPRKGYRDMLKSFLIRRCPKMIMRIFILFFNFIQNFKEYPGWLRLVLKEYRSDLKHWSPDIIISSYSPIDAHIAASQISDELNIPWVAEYRDCWSFNTMGFSENQNEFLSKVLRYKEKKILKGCQLILAGTPFIKSYYENFFKIHSQLLLGGWDEISSVSSINAITSSKIEILHLGSMLHGTRSVTPIISMLEEFPDLQDRYCFRFVGRDSELFRNEVNGSNAKKCISLTNHIPYVEAEKLGFQTDILLVLMKDSPMEKYTLTGKIFEYIKFQKPIICFDPFESEVSQLVMRYKMGHVVKSINDFANLLQSNGTASAFSKISNEDRLKFSRSAQISNLLKSLSKTIRDFAN
jgi:hypothetical protein|tara:strand:+ start:6924 stop:8159 length:1236 start_codon:yes stop_codon:yes gene_type:complete